MTCCIASSETNHLILPIFYIAVKFSYMKLIPALLLLAFLTPAKNNSTSKEVLQTMYSKYHGKWHKSLKFNQTTERFKNDSLVSTATWYETIVYPDLLRIDIGAEKSPNGILFRHDSTYRFANNK